MGSIVIDQYVAGKKHLFSAPVLEVGSRDYGNTSMFRSLFPSGDYVGIDMLEGENVDQVVDLTDSFEIVDEKLKRKRFNTIYCVSVMEHCANPFKMAENIENLLNPGGVVVIAVPFSWRIHGYPDDYWRFTPSGVRLLFPNIAFDNDESCLCTTKANDYFPLDQVPRSEFDTQKGIQKKQYGAITARMIKFIWRHELMPWLVRWPYLHPPIMVVMIGRKL